MENSILPITRSVEDAVTYPILTQQTSPPPSRGSGNGAAGGGATSPTRVTQDLMRQILGWRYRADDTKGFLAALTKAFTLTEVEGHTQWNFVPQNYSMQADLGEITGAQASLYARAKAAVDLSTPLLLGLTPLLPSVDIGDAEAMRSIVAQELPQLVDELGQPGGPRVQRVDSIFKLLIGPRPDYYDPERVQGHLGQLADRFGLKRRWVNTIEDEQNLTNFLILVDYVNSLFQTWEAQRQYFDRSGRAEPYLGTQLVLVSQALDSLAEAVESTYDSMDSVLIGAAERQTTELQFFHEPYLTAAELLSWTEDFAKNEGKQLVQDCGKDGVVAFRSTINRLNYLMFLAAKVSEAPRSGNLVHGFYTYRVRRSLQEIGQYLQLTQTEADRIRRREPDDNPALSAMNQPLSLELTTPKLKWPLPVDATQTPLDGVQIQVSGKNIQAGAVMRLISKHDPSQGFPGVTNLNSIAPTPGNKGQSMLATFDLTKAPQEASSVYTIVVINPDGQTGWLDDWFTLDTTNVSTQEKTSPVVFSVSPSMLRSSSLSMKSATLTIEGKYLLSAVFLSVGTLVGDDFTAKITFKKPSGATPAGPWAAASSVSLGNTLDVISNSRAKLTLKKGIGLPKRAYAIAVQGAVGVPDILQDALIVT
jgi:hypothetical protein